MAISPARPTLVTVARLAGVSVASASRVLSGGFGNSGDATAARPRGRRAARLRAERRGPLAPRRAHLQIGLAIADIGNPMYVAMMRGIESVTSAAGYRLLLHSTGADSAGRGRHGRAACGTGSLTG